MDSKEEARTEEVEVIFDSIEIVADNSEISVYFMYKGKALTSVSSSWGYMDAFVIKNIKGILPLSVVKN